MKKVLVLRGGALGDFLVTLPALALLRRRWPEARLELIGNATAAQLALNRQLVDAVHSQHAAKWHALYGDRPLPSDLAAWLDEFDLVISYWPDPERELRRRFPRHARQTFIFAGAMPTLQPAAAHYCEPFSTIGLVTKEFMYHLASHRPAEKVVAIHPGSGSPTKNWPIVHWRQLAENLRREFGAKLLVVSGEADGAAASALADVGTPLRNLPLEELVNHLAGAALFIGHDSGVSHLAAACGTPCVLLFGPSDPATWAPPASSVRVIRRGPDVSAISVADVLREAGSMLADRT